MALMRVRRAAQLTLPAGVRRALNVKEGDYLEAHLIEGGVMLRPVSVVGRKQAWSGIRRAVSQVKELAPDAAGDATAKEEKISETVRNYRRANRKHA